VNEYLTGWHTLG